jgi:hypothetical protein
VEYKQATTKIILLFSLALDETYAVFKISFATMLHTLGAHTGSDIFHFVVFFEEKKEKFLKFSDLARKLIRKTL